MGGALKKISVLGGPTTTLCESSRLRGASWGPDDDIVFASADSEMGLLRIPSAGGEPEVLTTPDTLAGELDHWWPEHLPGGKAMLFDIVSRGPALESQIAYLNLETGERKILIPGRANARYVSTGQQTQLHRRKLLGTRLLRVDRRLGRRDGPQVNS